MHTFAQKQNLTQKSKTTGSARPCQISSGPSSEVSSILHLQRTIGNQATRRFLQAKTEEFEESQLSNASNEGTYDLSEIRMRAKDTENTNTTQRFRNKMEQAFGINSDTVPVITNSQSASNGIEADILNLQQTMGNRVAGDSLKKLNNSSASSLHNIPPIVRSVLSSGSGRPLDPETRGYMEKRFGYDFGGVQVHTDGKAAESARAVNANAYTVGSDVAFGRNNYAPHTKTGKRLLAHELAHVIQNTIGNNTSLFSTRKSAHETEADITADSLIQGMTSIPIIKESGVAVAKQVCEDEDDNKCDYWVTFMNKIRNKVKEVKEQGADIESIEKLLKEIDDIAREIPSEYADEVTSLVYDLNKALHPELNAEQEEQSREVAISIGLMPGLAPPPPKVGVPPVRTTTQEEQSREVAINIGLMPGRLAPPPPKAGVLPDPGSIERVASATTEYLGTNWWRSNPLGMTCDFLEGAYNLTTAAAHKSYEGYAAISNAYELTLEGTGSRAAALEAATSEGQQFASEIATKLEQLPRRMIIKPLEEPIEGMYEAYKKGDYVGVYENTLDLASNVQDVIALVVPVAMTSGSKARAVLRAVARKTRPYALAVGIGMEESGAFSGMGASVPGEVLPVTAELHGRANVPALQSSTRLPTVSPRRPTVMPKRTAAIQRAEGVGQRAGIGGGLSPLRRSVGSRPSRVPPKRTMEQVRGRDITNPRIQPGENQVKLDPGYRGSLSPEDLPQHWVDLPSSQRVLRMPSQRQLRGMFGEPSSTRGGTESRSGMHHRELNEAEISPGRLRIDYDPAGRPRWVGFIVTKEATERTQESARAFRLNPADAGAMPTASQFLRSGYDLGHLAPREAFSYGRETERCTDFMNNVVPMKPAFNRQGGAWRQAELRTRRWAREYGSVRVEITPIYDVNPPTIGKVPIPKAFRRINIAPDGRILEDVTLPNE